jgi:inorganic pyrophosphatase
MSDLLPLPTFARGTNVHVVVETPRHAQANFKYDPKRRAFTLSRALTLASPIRTSGDSSPLRPRRMVSRSRPWCCKPLSVLEVLQTVKRRTEGNDHLMTVPLNSAFQPGIRDVDGVFASLRHQGEEFSVAAASGAGKTPKFLGWRGPRAAMAAIRRAQQALQRRSQNEPRR